MSYDFKNVTVLVIDDNEPMKVLVKSLLEAFGVGKVIMATDGIQGFNAFVQETPDIVLADWMMEPMNGIQLTRKIRTDPTSPNAFVPVILMTGFSEKRRVVMARDAGVTEFLVKPFNARALYRRISQVVERPRQFVKIDGGYFGPDRRRRKAAEYGGKDRRGPGREEAEQAPRRSKASELAKQIKEKR